MPGNAASRRWRCARPASAGCPSAASWPGRPILWRAWWLLRSGSPFVDDISAIARTLGRPGVWLLHGAYAFGRTALADDGPDGPVRRRTPRPTAPRAGQAGRGRPPTRPAGDFLNVTWPGFAGVLTAVAPGRFAASINQAPMRRARGQAGCCGSTMPRTPCRRSAPAAVRRPSTSCVALPPRPARRSMRPALPANDACRAPCAVPSDRVCVRRAPPIEHDGERARLYADRTVVANARREQSDDWRPLLRGKGTPPRTIAGVWLQWPPSQRSPATT